MTVAATLTVDRCRQQGEYQILRADLVYDSGVALNPALDIGQLEGVSSPADLSARLFALSQLSQLFNLLDRSSELF